MVPAAWFLTTNPFAAPLVERGADAARRALDRELARELSVDWLMPRLSAALEAGDLDAVDFYDGLARQHSIALPAETTAQITALREEKSGWTATASTCAACAWDITSCSEIPMIAACGIPVELTPLGDVNALRRAAVAGATGQEVDRLDLGLALVGLSATAMAVVTGGTSYAVKAGASGLRMARRMGHVPPRLTRELTELADVPVAWSRLPAYATGSVPLSAVTDSARLSRLANASSDAARIGRNTSATDAIRLLGHAESVDDLARIARVSDVAGPSTRASVEVLGTGRAFRTTMRIADRAIATLALIYASALQVISALAGWAGGWLLRLFRRMLG